MKRVHQSDEAIDMLEDLDDVQNVYTNIILLKNFSSYLLIRRILGIDPGSIKTGWGVIEIEGSRVTYLESGVLRLGSDDMSERLLILHRGLSDVIERLKPTECAVEGSFWRKTFSRH